jgi:hypothetical protein
VIPATASRQNYLRMLLHDAKILNVDDQVIATGRISLKPDSIKNRFLPHPEADLESIDTYRVVLAEIGLARFMLCDFRRAPNHNTACYHFEVLKEL